MQPVGLRAAKPVRFEHDSSVAAVPWRVVGVRCRLEKYWQVLAKTKVPLWKFRRCLNVIKISEMPPPAKMSGPSKDENVQEAETGGPLVENVG